MKVQKNQVIFISVITALLILCQTVQTQQRNQTADENARVARLVGLAKVWGTVKYFHPFLASRDIDWDKALIETIPKVNAAKTPQEYEAAVNLMLAALGDKATRASIVAEKPKTVTSQTPTVETKESVRLENGVLMIDAFAVAKTLVGANNRLPEFVTKTNQSLPQAKAVLIDLRSGGAVDETTSYFLDVFLRAIMNGMLDRNVPLAAVRYRMHNGYAPQTGGTSGGYYSAMTTTAPETLNGNYKSKTPPIVFLVDENSGSSELLSGLQAANAAFVVQDGESSVGAGATHTIKLPENVEVKMTTAEVVGADGTIDFAADLIAAKGNAIETAQRIIAENKFVSARAKNASTFAAQISQKDKTYPEMEFPNQEYRLLALFRFWTVINYFFPYKDLIDEPWDDVLPRYIPKFEANKDTREYRRTTQEMVAEIQDSHGGVRMPPLAQPPPPNYFTPFVPRYIENQTIVRHVLDENSGLKIGDAILEIDGEPIEKYREKHTFRIAASTPQALMRVMHNPYMFFGAKDSKARFKVRGLDGSVREVEIIRNVAGDDKRWMPFFLNERQTPVVEILPSGFGYVDLDRLTVAEVDKMFETIKNAPAVIFDMRGYPNGTAWAIAPRLTAKKSPVAAVFSRPILEATSLGDSDLASVNYTFAQRLPAAEGEIYKGKVVMLIDENAVSQSEHTALFFETATDVTFVGTPTTGANGDVTNMVLPGNLTVGFSGHNVRHADGRQLQRVGIQPHIKVAPTIRGTIEGRDEILEAAIKYLQGNVKK